MFLANHKRILVRCVSELSACRVGILKKNLEQQIKSSNAVLKN